MIGRRTVLITSLIALGLFAVSGTVLIAQWPSHGWAWMFAHYPVMERAYLTFWLAPPLVFTVFLFVVLCVALFRRGKPVTPGQRRFTDGGVIGVGVLSIVGEAVRVGSLFVYRAQRAQHLAAGGSAHSFHFDPKFIVVRISMALCGLFVIWLGNRLPKLAAPTAAQPDRLGQTARLRLGGWVFVVAGVGMFACAFVTPFLSAMAIDMAIVAGVLLIWIAAHWIYRPGGRSSSAASPL